MQDSVWSMEFGVWSMDFEAWSTYGEWSKEHRVPITEYGVQSMTSGVWSAASWNGKWSQEYRIRNMEH